MIILGLVESWWAILMVPGALLIGFGFAAICMAATTYMRSWQDFEFVSLSIMPMFLFSATFYPITVYPEWVQSIVMALPLWHGVELIRGLTTGILSAGMLWHVLYYVVMIAVGLVFTTKRLRALFLD
jgi:lipooligosaccharide transport system permease protein